MTLLLSLVASLVALIKSTDGFLSKSVTLFSYFRLPPFVVGVLVVGFGTSLPELGVAVMSALEGKTALAIGSAVGSNITNIALILGVTLIVLNGTLGTLRENASLAFLAAVSALLIGLSIMGGGLTRIEGVFLLALFVVFLILQLCFSSSHSEDPSAEQVDFPEQVGRRDYLAFAGLLVAVLLSSQWVVWSAKGMAASLQISEHYIGLTLIALGSSLPELVSSWLAVKKRQVGLMLGNVIGSNTMNSTLVVGAGLVIAPAQPLMANIYSVDMPWVLILSLMLWGAVVMGIWRRALPRKLLGLVWLLSYGLYLAYELTQAFA